MMKARMGCEKPTPVDMESEVEHGEVRTEEALVKSSATMKRLRGWYLAAGQRREPKELT
jgi:hypothetical protein